MSTPSRKKPEPAEVLQKIEDSAHPKKLDWRERVRQAMRDGKKIVVGGGQRAGKRALMLEIAKEYGMTVIGPPPPRLKKVACIRFTRNK